MFFFGLQGGSFEYVASCCVVRLEVFLRLLGRVCRSKGGFERLVAQQRTIVPPPLPFPMPHCTSTDRQRHLALRHDLWASVDLPLAPQRTRHDVSNLSLLRVLGEGSLPSFAQYTTQPFQNMFWSTLILANGVSRVPDAHSSKMSWWKMARASAPPSCRIAAVRAAISPSLSAENRLETYFCRNYPSGWDGSSSRGRFSCAPSLSCSVGPGFCASPYSTPAYPPWCGFSEFTPMENVLKLVQ